MDGPNKRKACQSCTRAKAKCSPSENRHDLCYRCQRLGKVCVYDETVRKRGPKHRSRVRQLEQRVESLIGLLESNGQSTRDIPILSNGAVPNDGLPSSTSSATRSSPQVNKTIPIDTPESDSEEDDEFVIFDPVDAGFIDDARADSLLNRFRKHFVLSFPFVVVPSSIDAKSLRHDQPFLFHAIMAVVTYETPSIQMALADEFRNQIASRIIKQSHKSLEILQGLLINAAWYHLYYKSKYQQLATVVHLCIAMVQDLDLSRKPKNKLRDHRCKRVGMEPSLQTDRTAAEKRAFLGTYFLAVALAQGFALAWRKTCNMVYTKFMPQCCQSLADDQEEPTDALITPLIQLSNLVSRVSDYFSYDDLDNAEFRGDLMLELSINDFSRELDRIRTAVPASQRQNTYLNLRLQLMEIWIYECAIHSSLWSFQLSSTDKISFCPARSRTLYRALKSTTAYLNTFLNIPDQSLYHLAFPAWGGWFYVIIMTCKLVFLTETEHRSPMDFECIPRDLTKLLPTEFTPGGAENAARSLPQPTQQPISTIWNPIAVANEAHIPYLFERFAEKFASRCSLDGDAAHLPDNKAARDPLWNYYFLQTALLNGFNKRMKEYTTKLSAVDKTNQPIANLGITSSATADISIGGGVGAGAETFSANTAALDLPYSTPSQPQTRARSSLAPFLESWTFQDVNFEGIDISNVSALPTPPQPHEPPQGTPQPQPHLHHEGPANPAYDDWVWTMMMEDLDFDMPLM